MSKFRLKKEAGTVQMKFGSSEFISNANITDEKAVEFLTTNPNRHILFDKLPENWKQMCDPSADDGERLPTVKELKKLTRANLDSMASTHAIDTSDMRNKTVIAEAIIVAMKEDAEKAKEALTEGSEGSDGTETDGDGTDGAPDGTDSDDSGSETTEEEE